MLHGTQFDIVHKMKKGTKHNTLYGMEYGRGTSSNHLLRNSRTATTTYLQQKDFRILDSPRRHPS